MTKSEFVDSIASGFDSKKAAADAVDAILDGITGTLASGGEVNFTGFGKFSVAERGPAPGSEPAHRRADHDRRRPRAEVLGWCGPEVEGQGLTPPFADRLAALVDERRSQVCLGIDPDPATWPAADRHDETSRRPRPPPRRPWPRRGS